MIGAPNKTVTKPSDHRSWVTQHGIGSESGPRQYLTALSWAYQTMTTVGYGDISVHNSTERLVAVVGMVFGVTVFGYIICTVAMTVSDGSPRDVKRKEKLAMVSAFMTDVNLPVGLASIVREQLVHVVDNKEESFESGQAIFPFLSLPHLKNKVTEDLNRHLLPLLP